MGKIYFPFFKKINWTKSPTCTFSRIFLPLCPYPQFPNLKWLLRPSSLFWSASPSLPTLRLPLSADLVCGDIFENTAPLRMSIFLSLQGAPQAVKEKLLAMPSSPFQRQVQIFYKDPNGKQIHPISTINAFLCAGLLISHLRRSLFHPSVRALSLTFRRSTFLFSRLIAVACVDSSKEDT